MLSGAERQEKMQVNSTGTSARFHSLSFLAGESGMARMIRDHDWSRNPLGLPESWPQSLRSALSICLHSAFPTAIYWGPELRVLYNDAWSSIPGPRHPAALGAPAREVWPDIWHVIEPQFAGLLATGEGFFAENRFLPMQRYGVPEETYWNYSFTAIRGESGEIAGIFNAGNETTETVLSQRRMGFVLELGQALRESPDAFAARRTATVMLGQHLRADRVGFCEVAPDGETVTITEEWVNEPLSPIGASVRLSDFGSHIGDALSKGRILRISDVAAQPELQDHGTREALARIEVGSLVVVPQMQDGRFVAGIFVHGRAPRGWSDHDVVTAQQVLDWTWGWIERERAAEREALMAREVDHRAKNALAVVQGVTRLTTARSAAEFKEKVEARIAALGRAHSLLAAGRWAAVDFRSLLREELAPFTAGRTARVRTDGPEVELPPELAQTVALVLHELTTNAVKHGSLSGRDGALDVHWRIGDGGALYLDWQESRPGAEPERLPSDAPTGFGTGMLARVVEQQLAGRIAYSRSGGALRCRIVIPLQAPLPPEDGISATHQAEPPSTGRPLRILIAEDEPLVAMDLEERARMLGFHVLGAFGTVELALAALDEALPDLAVLDVNLRGKLSHPVAEKLRRNGIPVVFATGYEEVVDLPRQLADVPRVSKPFSDAELQEALNNAIAGPRA